MSSRLFGCRCGHSSVVLSERSRTEVAPRQQAGPFLIGPCSSLRSSCSASAQAARENAPHRHTKRVRSTGQETRCNVQTDNALIISIHQPSLTLHVLQPEQHSDPILHSPIRLFVTEGQSKASLSLCLSQINTSKPRHIPTLLLTVRYSLYSALLSPLITNVNVFCHVSSLITPVLCHESCVS